LEIFNISDIWLEDRDVISKKKKTVQKLWSASLALVSFSSC